MKNLAVDSRWGDCGGIGRYSTEVLHRLSYKLELPSSIKRLSPIESLQISLFLHRNNANVLYSPSFVPSLPTHNNNLITIHDLIHLNVPEERTLSKVLFYNLLVKPAIRRSKYIFTVSNFSKHQISKWAKIDPNRIIVAPNGVGSEFNPNVQAHAPGFPYFIYIGNQKPHKNTDRLIRAFANADIPKHVKLLISGEPTSRTATLIAELGISNQIMFTGFISDSELPSYYKGAIALLFPSLYEGFGLPAIEAMACGTPVLTSNITSLPEVVGDCGILIDPYNVEAITKGINTMYANKELRHKLSIEGKKRSKAFDWDKTAKIIHDTISKVL